MGDRSNVFIQQEPRKDGTWDGVGIYSHWGGERFQQRALDFAGGETAAKRLGDPSYFARIVVQNLMDESFDADSDTGGGIWVTGVPDNEYPVLVINAVTGHHWYTDAESFRDPDPALDPADPF